MVPGSVRKDTLALEPRPFTLTATPPSGCIDTAHCVQLAAVDADARTRSTHVLQTPFNYVCQPAPAVGPGNLCVMSCATTPDCAVGSVCSDGRCVQGVIPDAACLTPLQRYEVRAGGAFTLSTLADGPLSSLLVDEETGACFPDPLANPLVLGRFGRTAPSCTGDSPTGVTPNPCTLDDYADPYAFDGENVLARPTTALRVRLLGLTFDIVDSVTPVIGENGPISSPAPPPRSRPPSSPPTSSPGSSPSPSALPPGSSLAPSPSTLATRRASSRPRTVHCGSSTAAMVLPRQPDRHPRSRDPLLHGHRTPRPLHLLERLSRPNSSSANRSKTGTEGCHDHPRRGSVRGQGRGQSR